MCSCVCIKSNSDVKSTRLRALVRAHTHFQPLAHGRRKGAMMEGGGRRAAGGPTHHSVNDISLRDSEKHTF